MSKRKTRMDDTQRIAELERAVRELSEALRESTRVLNRCRPPFKIHDRRFDFFHGNFEGHKKIGMTFGLRSDPPGKKKSELPFKIHDRRSDFFHCNFEGHKKSG